MRRNRSRKGRWQTEDRRYRTEGEIARGSRCARFPGVALFPFSSTRMLSLSVPMERASGAIQFLKTRKLTPSMVLGRRFQLTKLFRRLLLSTKTDERMSERSEETNPIYSPRHPPVPSRLTTHQHRETDQLEACLQNFNYSSGRIRLNKRNEEQCSENREWDKGANRLNKNI
ncbi:hypothetical protein KQX54_020647 [Cotesia glomerata]|uniref:Uncharacterized protein n=1 Tax=Cotesia glomerata TaxID=32391 RepID=A0AAV7I336_COTGL|nr:hypothetical protein KQX54_020647 [Cotesia glomerata]